MEGTPFGRYRLLSLLGRGGMGEVWRAYDTDTNRVVAVKVLPANLANDPQFEQRFRREANAAAGLNDPHVVPIHHFGEIDGRLYVDMRLIEGRDLHSVVSDGPLPPPRAVGIVDDIASALDAAHRIGLMHRDVKPSNILIGDRDFAYLIDFGIARSADETGMTNTGAVIGTLAYMAPERITGEADHRADIYALACVLHECLTGQQPFPGNSMEKQIGGHLGLPPPRPSMLRDTVPNQFDDVIAKGMAKNPDDRYDTASQLAEAARWAITTHTGQSASRRGSAFASFPGQDGGLAPNALTQQRTTDGEQNLARALRSGSSSDGNRRRLARIALASAVIVVTVVAVVVGLAYARKDSSDSITPRAVSSMPTATATATPDNGPLNGVFKADFSPSKNLLDVPDPGATPTTGTWSLRSTCKSTGCVATATVRGGPSLESNFTFDEIAGRWYAVAETTISGAPENVSGYVGCVFPAEYFTIISLQLLPNGTLAGDYTDESSDCLTKRTVALTRVGDLVDTQSVPDPAGLAPLIQSPAAGWRGRYRRTQTPDNPKYVEATRDMSVATACLRTGERCFTLFTNFSDDLPGAEDTLTYADLRWNWSGSNSQQCNLGGGLYTNYRSGFFPLPQPTMDPIPHIAGTIHFKKVGGTDCDGEFDSATTFDRIGD